MKGRIMQETILRDLERRTKMGLNCVLRRPTTMVWLFIPLLVVFGCASSVPPRLPVPEEVRAQLGTIGVVSADFIPEVKVPTAREKGKAAMVGAAKGLVIGLLGAVGCILTVGRWMEPCLYALGTPVLMVYGAVEEAKDRMPMPEAVEVPAEAVLALHQRKIQGTLRDQVIQTAQDRGRQPFVLLKEQGPNTLDEEVDYRHLASREIDTVLEVSVMKVGFGGPAYGFLSKSDDVERTIDEVKSETDEVEGVEEGGYNNWLFSVDMTARARLIRVKDNELLYARSYWFTSLGRMWSEWAEDCSVEEDCVFKGSQALGEAIEEGPRSLSRQIVEELQDAIQ